MLCMELCQIMFNLLFVLWRHHVCDHNLFLQAAYWYEVRIADVRVVELVLSHRVAPCIHKFVFCTRYSKMFVRTLA